MSLPLKARKLIKEAAAGFEEKLAKVSAVTGVPLTFVDNLAELYAAVNEVDASKVDKLAGLHYYADYMLEAFTELCKDEAGKEAAADILNSSGGKVKFIWRDASVSLTEYYLWDETAFQIELRSYSIGCWSTSYNDVAIQKKATVKFGGGTVGFLHKKKFLDNVPKIEKAMKAVSDAYGSEIKWDPDYTQLWNWLVANGDKIVGQDNLGNNVFNYVEFISEKFIEFIKDPDNKEAIQEKLTTPRFGFKYLEKKTMPALFNGLGETMVLF